MPGDVDPCARILLNSAPCRLPVPGQSSVARVFIAVAHAVGDAPMRVKMALGDSWRDWSLGGKFVKIHLEGSKGSKHL